MRTGNKRRIATEQVSELTTNRLSVYLRCLTRLEQAGVETVSSQGLAEQFQLNAAQIRKDLANFGEFGVRGVGYVVRDLSRQLRTILGLNHRLTVVVTGAGKLGQALADYPGFGREGFEIVAMFDTDPAKVGQHSRSGIPILHSRTLRAFAARTRIDIAILAVPGEVAQEVLDLIVDAGVRAVLNFSPGGLRVPETVRLKHVDLTVSLEGLSFFLAQGGESGA